MTSKEALEELLVMATLCLNKEVVQRLAIIKKDLEVLEIIKEKQVDIFYINVCKNAESYNKYKTSIKKLTNDEFDKIKKTLEVKENDN